MPVARSELVRLTALAGTWALFDVLNRNWRVEAGNYDQFVELLAFVTGDGSRPSLYRDLKADISKCLLAIRVRRSHQATLELDLSEQ